MSNFDPTRDCKHGHQKGKCDSCDLEQAAALLEQQAAELDALKAHVERLREDLKSILGWRELRNTSAIPIDRIEEVARMALDATPQQSLSERDAEVARKAFIAGFKKGHSTSSDSYDSIINTSNEYAQHIKEGDQRP